MADTTAPVLRRTAPADDATSVTVASNLTLDFNEPVRAGSGVVNIHKADGMLFHSIVTNDTSQVRIIGSRVIVDPSVVLLPNTSYYVTINAGAFEDLAGNDHAGVLSETALNFTTGDAPEDSIAPVLTGTAPADDATNVGIGADLVLTFNENVKAGWGFIEIHDAATGILVDQPSVANYATVTFAGNNEVVVNSFSNLLPGKDYYVTVTPGAILDLAGNAFAGISAPTVFNFSVPADTAPPVLLNTSPTNDTVVPPGTNYVLLVFNEAVARGSGNINIYRAADNSLFESISVQDISGVGFWFDESGVGGAIAHRQNHLSPGTAYYVLVDPGAIEDLSGNEFAGITSPTHLSFTTMVVSDGAPPVLLASNPSQGATNVAVDADITLTFNEAVIVDVGEIRLTQMGGNWSSIYIPAYDTSQVSISGGNVTIDPAADLETNMQYQVFIDANVFADLSGTWFPGTTLTFTTADNVAPSLVSSLPPDDATGVGTGANLWLIFSEPIQAGTGVVELRYASTGAVARTYHVSNPSEVDISGSILMLLSPSDLSFSTDYYLAIASGVILDLVGNPIAGITSPTTLNFTTTNIGISLTGDGASNTLIGDAGDNVITGLGRGDRLTGAGGADRFVYTSFFDSNGRSYDKITDLDASADTLDLWFEVTGIDATIPSGAASLRRIDLGLASVVGPDELAAHHAVLFTPDSGTPAGSTLLIVDANGMAGYQPRGDLAILLGAASDVSGLTAADFV